MFTTQPRPLRKKHEKGLAGDAALIACSNGFNAEVLNNSLNENAGTSKSRYAAVAKCVTRMSVVHKTHNKLSRELQSSRG